MLIMMKNTMIRKYYPFAVCLTAMIVWVCSIGLTSTVFSITVPYIIRDYGFTNTMATTINTYRVLSSVVTAYFLDKIINQFGYKSSILLALGAQIVGYCFLTVSKSYAWFVIGALFMGVTNAVAGMATLTMVVANWFHSGRGLAVSLLACGSGISSMIVPRLVTNVAEKSSLKSAYLIIIAIIAAVALISAVVLRNDPSDIGLEPYSNGVAEQAKEKKYGPGISTKKFLLLCFAMACLGFVANIANVSLASLYREIGFSAATVSRLMSIYGVGMIIGKLIYGGILDKKGNQSALIGFIAAYTAGTIFIGSGLYRQVLIAVISILLLGFGASVTSLGITCTAYDFLAEEGFIRRMKNITFCNSLGSMVSGIVCGYIADTIGSYRYSMVGAMAALILSLAIFAFLYRSLASCGQS